jgi:hypothetical protein
MLFTEHDAAQQHSAATDQAAAANGSNRTAHRWLPLPGIDALTCLDDLY